ncbi:MAG: diguanylate cyclase [Bacillota bacterium]|nr:diguanylate cyclase [Bacillota bacterium]
MKARVLLADDSPTILKVVGSVLEQAGYEVITATNGVEAAEKAYAERPNLVLLDVIMPGMNGYQVCRLIKNEPALRQLPVVILTSRDQPRDRFWGYQTGADEYVTKGFDQSRLLEVVQELLAKCASQAVDEAAAPALAGEHVDILSRSNDLLDRKLFEATVINEIGKLATVLQSYEQTVDGVLSLVHRLVDYAVAAVAIIHDDHAELTLKLWSPVVREYLEEFKHRLTEELKQYVPARFFTGGLQTQLLYAEGLGITTEVENAPSQIEDFLFVPIMAKGEVVGGLGLTTPPGRQFTKDDQLTLHLIATHAYLVIENAWLYEQVKKLSITDGLTRVYNRRYLEERLEQEFRRSQRHKTFLTALMLDIDHFKHINDTYGHQMGDEVLRKLMELCRQVTRSTDIIGRYGGEEFMVLLPETDLMGGKCVAERLRKLVETQTFTTDKGPIRITISLGICTMPAEGIETALQLVKGADEALYRAKQTGRNRTCVASVNETDGSPAPGACPDAAAGGVMPPA